MVYLENPSTENNFDKKTLENLLDTLVNIEQVYVPKEEFEVKKSTGILVENWENELWKFYNLYLPQKMHEDDYLFIIKELNKHSFWDNLPEYASVNELKIILLTKVDILMEKLNITFWDKKENDSNKIREYLSYYLKLFPEEKNKLLLNEKYKKFVIELKYIDKNNQCEVQTEQDLSQLSKELYIPKKPINTIEEFSDELIYKNIDEQVLKEFWEHFDEAFFEEWIENLRQNMMTFTQDDAKKLNLKENEKLNKNPRRLRDAIWIDKFKKELEEVRKIWNQKKLEEKEIEVSNAIFKEIYKYPYQDTENSYWYQINKLDKYKEIYCVWFSIIWHAFLSELGIKHNVLDIPFPSLHSAIEIIIWWKNYFFDSTTYNKIYEFTFWKKVLSYKKINFINNNSKINFYANSWIPEKVLLSQIYNNKWNDLNNPEQAIKMFNKVIELNPQFSYAYYNILKPLKYLWKHDEVIKMFKRGEWLFPLNQPEHLSKVCAIVWDSFEKLWKTKLSNLYLLASKLIEWEDDLIGIDILYREEKANIRDFIKQEKYKWLQDYLLSLEEKE